MKRFRISLFTVILVLFCSCGTSRDELLLQDIVIEYQTVIATLPPNATVSLAVVIRSMETSKQKHIERLVREGKISFYDHTLPETTPQLDLPLLVYHPKRVLVMRSGAAQEWTGETIGNI